MVQVTTLQYFLEPPSIFVNVASFLCPSFSTYGKISEEELLIDGHNFRARVFEITEPMIVMYNEVDELIELGVAATNPYTDAQIVKLAIKLKKS